MKTKVRTDEKFWRIIRKGKHFSRKNSDKIEKGLPSLKNVSEIFEF